MSIRRVHTALVALLFCACTNTPAPTTSEPAPAAPAPDMGAFLALIEHLEGHWEQRSENDSTVFNEQWRRSDGALRGMGFVMSGRDTVWIEHLYMHWNETGATYEVRIPAQNGGHTIPFRLVLASEREMIFENMEHDFPQRLGYQWEADTWRVVIDGTDQGLQRAESFQFTRRSGSL